MPTSRVNNRAKWRLLSPATPASVSTLRSSARCSSTWRWAQAMGVSSRATSASSGLNWAWPPWRFMATSNTLATSTAILRPWSSARIARAMSMPAVMPPEVTSSPSCR